MRRRRRGPADDSDDPEADGRAAALSVPGAAPSSGADADGRPKSAVYDATKVPPVTLKWSDLGYDLTLKSGERKRILKGVEGHAAPGRLLAIM